ncbi:MAG TPA: hypothetical protein VE526_18000 [Solirubrobacteraceae bacterium]|nr:hypothetical protein [Solirubrobacteraceae bacterium]
MTMMRFSCPTTGLALQEMALDEEAAGVPGARLALHCPKCSQMHVFTEQDAVVEEPVPA